MMKPSGNKDLENKINEFREKTKFSDYAPDNKMLKCTTYFETFEWRREIEISLLAL